jgi:arylsulfatase A-like enzyme
MSAVGSRHVGRAAVWRGAAILAAVLTATAVAADLVSVRGAGRAPAGAYAQILAASACWAARASLAFAVIAGGWMLGARALARHGRAGRIAAAAGVAALPALAFVLGGLDLLGGHGISAKSYVGALRIGVVIAVPLGFFAVAWLAGALARRRERRAPARPWTVLFLGVAAIAALLAFDALWKPHLYAAAHLLAWLAAALVAAFVVAAFVLSEARARLRLPLILATIVAFLAFMPGLDLDEESAAAARRHAYSDTLFLKRALRYLARAPRETAAARIDPELAERLALRPVLDPATLDAAFPDRRRFNVLLISVDALRADRIGMRRDGRPLAPHIERFLAGAAVFDEAWTAWPSTLMAFSALFRGMPATATDVYREFAAPGSVPDEARQTTLAQALAAGGRRCEAATTFFNPYWVNPFKVGFEIYNDYPRPRTGELLAAAMTDHALRAIDRDASRPFFVWVHYWDPHDPYDPPAGYASGSSAIERYDGEVRYADEHVGRLLAGVRARGLADRTVICLFSDHGEEFGEHGRVSTHGSALSRLQVRVPLGIAVPGARPQHVSSPVSLTDLAPTVLEICGMEPPESMTGRSLVRYVLAGDPPGVERHGYPAPVVYAELDDEEILSGRQVAAQEGPWKITLDLDARVHTLHDVAADPEERHDLALERPEKLGEMRRVLDALRAAAQTPPGAASSGMGDGSAIGSARWISAALRTLSAPITPGPPSLRALTEARKGRVLRDLAGRHCPIELEAAVEKLTDAAVRPELRRLAARALGGVRRPSADALERWRELAGDADAVVADEARIALAAHGETIAPRGSDDAPPIDPAARWRALRLGVARGDARALDHALALAAQGASRDADTAALLRGLVEARRIEALPLVRHFIATPEGEGLGADLLDDARAIFGAHADAADWLAIYGASPTRRASVGRIWRRSSLPMPRSRSAKASSRSPPRVRSRRTRRPVPCGFPTRCAPRMRSRCVLAVGA